MKLRDRKTRWLAVIMVLVAAAAGESLAQAAFTGFGVIEGEKAVRVVAFVSADGSTVVGTDTKEQEVDGEDEKIWIDADLGFRWTAAGGVTNLPLPESFLEHRALGASGNGSVIVGEMMRIDHEQMEEVVYPFRWTEANGFALLPMPAGAIESGAIAVSSDGTVVVGYMDSEDGIQAFRSPATNVVNGLGFFPNGIETRALGVSSNGSVIVGYGHHADGVRAFRWTEQGGLQNLGVLTNGIVSRAAGVSADGSVVVGVVEFGKNIEKAFRWTQNDGMTDISAEGVVYSLATAVSADGSVIVGQMTDADGNDEAFVWDAVNGMRSIRDILLAAQVNVENWQLDLAMGVSSDGSVIVGVGDNPDEDPESWRAVLPAP